MNILLTSNASYLPPRGGSTRSNLAYLRALKAAGHSVRVVCSAPDNSASALDAELREQGLDTPAESQSDGGTHAGVLDGIEIFAVKDLLRHLSALDKQIKAFAPDWVLVSSEDISHSLLRQATVSSPGRVVYLAHTPQFFPFGPAAWHVDHTATGLLSEAAGVITISEAMAEYVRVYLKKEAPVIHPPMYESASAQRIASFDNRFVAMVNPCEVKGLSIFLNVAGRMSEERFAVLPGWGTTSDDLHAIAQHPNITVLPRVPRISDFLRQTRLLLVPSLWLEGFGLIAQEAILAGVPVVASDSGGLREAKTGTRFLLPVNLIETYLPAYDERLMPRAVVPQQQIEPWIDAVRQLTSDRDVWQEESAHGRAAAQQFVAQLDPDAVVRYLLHLTPATATAFSNSSVSKPRTLAELSETKRTLLLQRLKAKQPGQRN